MITYFLFSLVTEVFVSNDDKTQDGCGGILIVLINSGFLYQKIELFDRYRKISYRCRSTFLNISRISSCSCSAKSLCRKYAIQASLIICGQCGFVQAFVNAK